MTKTEANLPQEKKDFINDAHQKELQYRKKDCIREQKRRRKETIDRTDLAPLRDFLARKGAVKNEVKNVNEIIFYLNNQHLPQNEEQGTS